MLDFYIFVDTKDTPNNKHPLSFYIEKRPTELYEFKSNNPNPYVYIEWGSSYYDSRK